MNLGEAYGMWSRRIALSLPSLSRFLYAIPACSLSQRKALLNATRVQSFPHPHSRLYHRSKEDWDSIVELTLSHQHPEYRDRTRYSNAERLLDIAGWVKPLFHSPITSGFLSSVIRSAPAPHPSFNEARSIGLVKEIQASLEVYHPVVLNYDTIFANDPHYRNSRFAPNLDCAPSVASSIHHAFHELRISLNNSFLFPKTSSKRVGDVVAKNFWEMAPRDFIASEYQGIMESGVTTTVLERLSFFHGIQVDGPVEVRTAWKYNDLKPRVYFAQGGSTFWSSKFIQEIFNTIADALEVTHTKNRYFVPLESIAKEESAIIYDYSSFTSTIQEVTRFVGELSKFFKGTTVFLVEGKGLKTMDLGDLLALYNQDCNIYAEFDIGRVASFPDETSFILGHTCGMLGVPGNIQAATILHGIHLAFVSGSLTNCRCVGDDALFFRKADDLVEKIILQQQLQNIGRISSEKTEFFPYDDEDDYDLRAWQYTKRPFLRYHNRIISYWLTTFPTLDCLIGLQDKNRTVLPDSHSLHNRRKKFFNIWHRMLFRLWSEGGELDDDEREFLAAFQKRAFKDLEIFRLRVGKHYQDGFSFFVPLFLHKEEFGQNPLDFVARDYAYEEEVLVPLGGTTRRFPLGYIGEEFESASSRLLSYLDRMGVISKEMLFDTISRSLVGDTDFARRILKPESIMYKYTVIRRIPTWMHSQMPDTA